MPQLFCLLLLLLLHDLVANSLSSCHTHSWDYLRPEKQILTMGSHLFVSSMCQFRRHCKLQLTVDRSCLRDSCQFSTNRGRQTAGAQGDSSHNIQKSTRNPHLTFWQCCFGCYKRLSSVGSALVVIPLIVLPKLHKHVKALFNRRS